MVIHRDVHDIAARLIANSHFNPASHYPRISTLKLAFVAEKCEYRSQCAVVQVRLKQSMKIAVPERLNNTGTVKYGTKSRLE
jgi:hypothetical protein